LTQQDRVVDDYVAAKLVQVSLDGELLRRIDRDPEAKTLGRSAFIRNAVSAYLQAKERREIDAAIRKAYEAKADDGVCERTRTPCTWRARFTIERTGLIRQHLMRFARLALLVVNDFMFRAPTSRSRQSGAHGDAVLLEHTRLDSPPRC
jgi:predicted transcriptional regulator